MHSSTTNLVHLRTETVIGHLQDIMRIAHVRWHVGVCYTTIGPTGAPMMIYDNRLVAGTGRRSSPPAQAENHPFDDFLRSYTTTVREAALCVPYMSRDRTLVTMRSPVTAVVG